MRDDAVQLEGLGRVTQRVDHGVGQPALLAVVAHHRRPARRNLLVVRRQAPGRSDTGARRLVTPLDTGQPYLLGPHQRIQHRAHAGFLTIPVQDHLTRRNRFYPLRFRQHSGRSDERRGVGDIVRDHQQRDVGALRIPGTVQPQRLRRMEMHPIGRGQPETDVGGLRRGHPERAPERAGEHLRCRPSLVERHRGHPFPALQPPGRPLQHHPAAQRGRWFAGEPADLPGEMELRGETAACHPGHIGVRAVHHRVEELTEPIPARPIRLNTHSLEVSRQPPTGDMTFPAGPWN